MSVRRLLLAAALSCVAGAGARAQAPELSRADLSAWLDGYLESGLQRTNLAGAVVVVVRNGEVLFEKGYGFADLDSRRPMDPIGTGVRAASISKLFTATALMQLVEAGKVDLAADANRYLDFQLPSAYGQPVLVRDLLTHAAGFSDVQKGSSPRDPRWLVPLAQYLPAHLPRIVFPRGDTPGYSNYGFAVAAYIVQRISGEPFEEYLERHVLGPLGMSRTTCRQPLPDSIRLGLSNVYPTASDPPKPTDFTVWRGAGCIVTTASDMARFMTAHLRGGQLGETRILRGETARAMHETAFAPVPHVNGMALGFFREDRNGHRIVGHDGDFGFHSDLHLFLDDDTGIFVSFNGDGVGGAVFALREGLFEEFADRYFPGPPPQAAVPTATGRAHARLAAGSYEASRRLTGPLSMFMVLNQIAVTDRGDGTIAVPAPPSGEERIYQEVGPWLWREVGGTRVLEMRTVNGRVRDFFDHPVGGFVRVPWWKSGRLDVPLFLAVAVVLILTTLWWPVAALVRRRLGRPSPYQGRELLAYRLARVGTVANLIFLLGWATVAMGLLSCFYLFNEGLDPWFRLLHTVGLVGMLGTLAVLWSAALAWRHRRWWASRLWATILAAASLILVWLVVAFDLITLDLRY